MRRPFLPFKLRFLHFGHVKSKIPSSFMSKTFTRIATVCALGSASAAAAALSISCHHVIIHPSTIPSSSSSTSSSIETQSNSGKWKTERNGERERLSITGHFRVTVHFRSRLEEEEEEDVDEDTDWFVRSSNALPEPTGRSRKRGRNDLESGEAGGTSPLHRVRRMLALCGTDESMAKGVWRCRRFCVRVLRGPVARSRNVERNATQRLY